MVRYLSIVSLVLSPVVRAPDNLVRSDVCLYLMLSKAPLTHPTYLADPEVPYYTHTHESIQQTSRTRIYSINQLIDSSFDSGSRTPKRQPTM